MLLKIMVSIFKTPEARVHFSRIGKRGGMSLWSNMTKKQRATKIKNMNRARLEKMRAKKMSTG